MVAMKYNVPLISITGEIQIIHINLESLLKKSNGERLRECSLFISEIPKYFFGNQKVIKYLNI